MEKIFINQIENAFKLVEIGTTKLTNDILSIDGMSGKKTKMFYNNLLAFNTKINYLEIGVWKGSTFISAMFNNKNIYGYALDSFSNFSVGKSTFLNNVSNYLINNEKYIVIEKDCFDGIADDLISQKIQVYLYDAGHCVDDHIKSLIHYLPILDDIFIFIVDDWNYDDVRKGTIESIKLSNVTILYEKEIRLTYDNSTTPIPLLHTDYWNGMYIAVLKKN